MHNGVYEKFTGLEKIKNYALRIKHYALSIMHCSIAKVSSCQYEWDAQQLTHIQ